MRHHFLNLHQVAPLLGASPFAQSAPSGTKPRGWIKIRTGERARQFFALQRTER